MVSGARDGTATLKSQAPFGRAFGAASRAAPGEALLNVCFCNRLKPVLKPSAVYTGKGKP